MRTLAIVSLLALAVLLRSVPANAASLAELIENSKKENELNLHTNGLDYGVLVAEAFSKTYPWIKIHHKTFPPLGPFTEGYTAKNPVDKLDVKLRCQIPNLLIPKEKNWVASMADLPSWNAHPAPLEDDAHYVYFLGAPHVLIYNSAVIKEAAAPRTYEELTGPAWSGKVAMRNPLMGNSGAFLADFMAAQGHLDWYTRMAANHAFIADDQPAVFAAVASGEHPVGLTRDVEVLAALANPKYKDLKMRFVDGVLPYQYQLAEISAAAPHPYAAKLFANWLISEAGQKALADAGYSVGARQKEHLARGASWRMNVVKSKEHFDAHLIEAVSNLHRGGALWPQPVNTNQAANKSR